jgi:prophage DNA circulation protein
LAVTTCALVVLALCGVATGATQNATPKKWISVFCGSVLTWEHTVQSNTVKLDATFKALKSTGKADIPTVKGKLVTFLNGIVKSTNGMVSNIKHLGAPNVKNGAKLQSAVLSAFALVQKAFDQTLSSAKKLPTNSVSGFQKQALALAKTLQANTSRLSAAFNPVQKYSTAELNAAAKADPACKKLGD